MNRRQFLFNIFAVPIIAAIKPNPKQLDFIRNNRYVLYGGSYGGGKSNYLFYMTAINLYITNPAKCCIISNIGEK